MHSRSDFVSFIWILHFMGYQMDMIGFFSIAFSFIQINSHTLRIFPSLVELHPYAHILLVQWYQIKQLILISAISLSILIHVQFPVIFYCVLCMVNLHEPRISPVLQPLEVLHVMVSNHFFPGFECHIFMTSWTFYVSNIVHQVIGWQDPERHWSISRC